MNLLLKLAMFHCHVSFLGDYTPLKINECHTMKIDHFEKAFHLPTFNVIPNSLPKIFQRLKQVKHNILCYQMVICLVVEPTHLKNTSQNGNLPQIGVNIKKQLKPPTTDLS